MAVHQSEVKLLVGWVRTLLLSSAAVQEDTQTLQLLFPGNPTSWTLPSAPESWNACPKLLAGTQSL